MKNKIVLVKQQDESDCGAACIATIAKHYGKRIAITKIRNVAGTDRRGTTAKGIEKAAGKFGFTCKIMSSHDKKISGDLPFPLIAHVIKNGLEHYIVVYKIKGSKILVADPGDSILWINEEDFVKMWSGIFFLISPNQTFEKTSDDKTFIQRFFHLLTQNKKTAVEVFVASFIMTLLGILGHSTFVF